jgi:hypothetical protein
MGIVLKRFILCVAGCLLLLNSFNISANEADKYIFSLPVNATISPKVIARITIPNNFRPLQDISVITKGQILEFIPISDTDEYNWTEIITVQLLLGKHIRAQDFTKLLKKNISKHGSNAEVLADRLDKTRSHSSSTLIMKYSINKRYEILIAKYISGPYDCTGIQYSVLISKDVFEDEVKLKEQLEKMNIFLEDRMVLLQ